MEGVWYQGGWGVGVVGVVAVEFSFGGIDVVGPCSQVREIGGFAFIVAFLVNGRGSCFFSLVSNSGYGEGGGGSGSDVWSDEGRVIGGGKLV